MFPISDANTMSLFLLNLHCTKRIQTICPPEEVDPINTESLDTTPPPDKRLI